jgi:hypothetical protein
LGSRERAELAKRLHNLGERWHIELPTGTSDEALTTALAALDQHLQTPQSRQGTGPLRDYGPLQRQLRVLLWKHGIADYNARGLNTVELLERLEVQLDQQRKPGKESRD